MSSKLSLFSINICTEGMNMIMSFYILSCISKNGRKMRRFVKVLLLLWCLIFAQFMYTLFYIPYVIY